MFLAWDICINLYQSMGLPDSMLLEVLFGKIAGRSSEATQVQEHVSGG